MNGQTVTLHDGKQDDGGTWSGRSARQGYLALQLRSRHEQLAGASAVRRTVVLCLRRPSVRVINF